MTDSFISMGDALDKAIDAIGPTPSKQVITALETILEAANAGGLVDPSRGVIEDFIANLY